MKMNQEIRAEMLLGRLYPDREKNWTVTAMGGFYRNYNSDIIDMDDETGRISLARDGLLQLLPDEMISPAEELRGEGFARNRKKMLWRQTLLRETFTPIDTARFAQGMELERRVSDLLNERDDYVLRNLIGIDPDTVTDPLVREALAILPRVATYRGNLKFVRELLVLLTDCPVEMDLSHRYSTTESDRAWMPMVWYHILKADLDQSSFIELTNALQPLIDFLREWLIPYDMACRIDYRSPSSEMNNGKPVLLGYNTPTPTSL